jgi:hypothetical protein
MQYLRARYFDPSSQSFISRDPAVLLEPYSYAGNSPQSNSDPSGLDWADAGRVLLDGAGWLAYVPFLDTGLDMLAAYSAIRHCEFSAASEYLAPVVMSLIAGVLTPMAGVLFKDFLKVEKKGPQGEGRLAEADLSERPWGPGPGAAIRDYPTHETNSWSAWF